MLNRELIKAIIILPGSVLVLIPSAILLLTQHTEFAPGLSHPADIRFWLAVLLVGAGLTLAIWTSTLFVQFGKGTPAPWQPPKKLVICGPYCFVRNPMIMGVLFMLLAEALLFQSWAIVIWMLLFLAGNMVYFPLVEEKNLQKRFGDEYMNYKAHVPRWIPRIKPWNPPS